MSDDFGFLGFEPDHPDAVAARKHEAATGKRRLASLGYFEGEAVEWDGCPWTVVAALADGRLLLHSDQSGRKGFAEAAPDAVRRLRAEG